MNLDTQRLIALIVFSFSSLLLWDAWQKHNAPKIPPQTHAAATTSGVPAPSLTPAAVPGTTPAANGTPPAASAPATAAEPAGQPVHVKTDLVDLELNTAGGDIRRLTFLEVSSALDRTKPLTLLEPNPKHFFVSQSGLLGEGLPTHLSAYTAESNNYVMGAKDSLEVRLHAKDANGADVTKKYTFHRGSYAIDVTYEIANRGANAMTPTAYFQFMRDENPPSEDAAQTSKFGGVSTFTGPALYTDEAKFLKIDFSDVSKGKAEYPKHAKDGWIGMIQHYFASAWIPPENTDRDYYINKISDNRFAAGVKVPMGQVAPGATGSVTVRAYIGPQETAKLEKVAPGLDRVVDYGRLYILAAPLFWLLKTLHDGVTIGGMHIPGLGNWGWAIIALTVLIKLAFYPLNAKAGRSMAQMKVLAPKMEKLKEMYGDDRQKLNQAMMELYRTEKINPLGGCLPILVQIPVFIALYWVLLGSIELRHAPWLGWIQDLSAPDPYFILPVIYAVSMFVQTKLNPQPADPVQAKVMLIMPIVFSVFFLFFPSGLVLYWVVQNLLTIVQQWHINRTLAREAEAKAKGRR